jgi:hypothetical protein
MNQFIVTRNEICNELAFIFDANPKYIERLFRLGRITLPNINIVKLLKKESIKFADLFGKSALCNCANAIFFLCADEDDTKLHDMHSVFISHIHDHYSSDADLYGEGIKNRCKTYKMRDIDCMIDELSNLQIELDGDVESERDES